jgi:hypothetical protein
MSQPIVRVIYIYIAFHLYVNLQQLYELGCRKMLIAGLVPIGCLPIQMTLKFQNPEDRKCIENQNLDAKIYNSKLVNLLPQIQAQLPESHIAYADVYGPLSDMINNPTKYGKLIHLISNLH